MKKKFTIKASRSAIRRRAIKASDSRDTFWSDGKWSIVTAARDTTVDKEAVRELVLYITNKSDLYPQVQSIVKNMQRKIKQGKYDDELAVKAWQYLADAGVEKYDKEFGSGNGTKSMLNKATREQIARELRDYFADEVNDGVEASKSVTCSQDISGSNLITL